MRETYSVDVIVPVYNIEKYIGKCVESILAQTYSDTRIILVDDGSTDRSGEICEQYAEQHDNVQVFHKRNGGLVSAWKAGVQQSRSDWLIFVDGDDWIEERHIECLTAEQISSNADIVVMQMKLVREHDSSRTVEFDVPVGNYSGSKLVQDLYPVLLNAGGFEKRGVPVSRASKLMRKELLLANIDYCDDSITFEEDLCVMFPTLLDAKSISLVKAEDSAYCYRVLSGSMSHAYNAKMQDSISRVYPSIIKACQDKEKMQFLPQIQMEYICSMIRSVTNELKNPIAFQAVLKNVREISEDEMLKESVDQCDISAFPFRFKVIAAILKEPLCLKSAAALFCLYIFARIRR